MTRTRLATILGVLVAVSSVLVLLAGSDMPPPPGFVLVIPVAIGIGILVRVVIPQMLQTRDRAGLAPALMGAIGAGAAAGLLMGLLFAAIRSTGPSTPRPGLLQLALFVLVLTIAGALAAAAVSALAIVADRARTRTRRILTLAVPGLIVVLVPAIVIADRFPG